MALLSTGTEFCRWTKCCSFVFHVLRLRVAVPGTRRPAGFALYIPMLHVLAGNVFQDKRDTTAQPRLRRWYCLLSPITETGFQTKREALQPEATPAG